MEIGIWLIVLADSDHLQSVDAYSFAHFGWIRIVPISADDTGAVGIPDSVQEPFFRALGALWAGSFASQTVVHVLEQACILLSFSTWQLRFPRMQIWSPACASFRLYRRSFFELGMRPDFLVVPGLCLGTFLKKNVLNDRQLCQPNQSSRIFEQHSGSILFSGVRSGLVSDSKHGFSSISPAKRLPSFQSVPSADFSQLNSSSARVWRSLCFYQALPSVFQCGMCLGKRCCTLLDFQTTLCRPCQILFRLGVEKLVLPAVPDVHATWKGAFGFQDCSPDSRKELSELEIMVFPGTTLLQKSVADAVSNHKQTAISALVGATLLSVVFDGGAPEKAPANGVALPYSTRWELSEWEELARNSHPPAKEELKGLVASEERKPGVPTLKRKRSGISSPVAGSSKGFRGLLPKGGGEAGQPRPLGSGQGGGPEVYSSKVVSGCPESVFIGERQSAFSRDCSVFGKKEP
jgi:hypothetical protein